jgi:hypothetical protein
MTKEQSMYLVLIETSGNQNYIFSTNKLRENIGASELTYRAGTEWVLDAVKEITGNQLWNSDRVKLRENLLNQQTIESSGILVEVIIATSGKALIIVKDRNHATQIIQKVTKRALCEAPGLDICGVISNEFNWNIWENINSKKKGLGLVNEEVHQKFELVRSNRPSPSSRFLRLPIIDECATSGLPASTKKDKRTSKPISSVSASKQSQEVSQDAFDRMNDLLKGNRKIRFVKSIGELDKLFGDEEKSDQVEHDDTDQEKTMAWRAIVHADGNGLGEIFLGFHEYVSNNREYIDQYRRFSIALDICTEKAFLSALNVFTAKSDDQRNQKKIPLVPLVLGGDDLTVVCDGKYALNFTQVFLQEFEKNTSRLKDLEGKLKDLEYIISGIIAQKTNLKASRLSACAGVAIVKLHFPFSIAYELAEALIKSAKTVKKKVLNPCSALDFHVLYDSSSVDLGKIRHKLMIKDGDNPASRLYQRPYVVTKLDQIQEASGQEWAKLHQWEELEKRVMALQARDKDDDRSNLPNSQIHDLRANLFLGKEGADARYQLIRDRYLNRGIQTLEGDKESLFSLQEEDGGNIYITALLDAIEATEFLQSEEGKGNG